MQSRIQPLMLTLLALFLAACGSGISGGNSPEAVSSSSGCITASCHGALASKVTGRPIASEWRASTHFAANVAGCRTCHGHSHQNSCQNCHGGGTSSSTQVDQVAAEESCLVCHVRPGLLKGLDGKHQPELNGLYGTTSTFSLTQGWNNSTNPPTAANTTAGWMVLTGTSHESKCIWCHNPHDNRVLPQHGQWAESGHGNPAAGYTRSDMKFRGSPGDFRTQVAGESCVRCHTATGFVNWVESGMTDVSAWGKDTLIRFGSSTTAKAKQTLYCNVCHDNGKGKAYGYNLRSIPAQGANGGVRVYMNYSAVPGTLISSSSFTNATTNSAKTSIVPQVNPATDRNSVGQTFARIKVVNNFVDFPNVGISDRCVLCHGGRANKELIRLVANSTDASGNAFNFRLNGRIGTHDFAGAGTMFRALGFEFYSSFHYAQPGNIPYAHDQIGQANFAGTGNRGPCVTCHMSSGKSHSYMPVTLDATGAAITSIDTALCSTCHASGGPGNSRFDGSVTGVNGINVKKTGFAAALKAFKAWANMKGINSTSNWLRSSTYTGGRNNRTNGTALAANGFSQTACDPSSGIWSEYTLGTRNMGVGLNSDFLGNDPGAFVHNDLYVKRLLYDTIDWLDNCAMDNSVESAINLTSNTSIFLGSSDRLNATEKSNAIKYLMGAPGGGRPGGM